MAKKRKTAKTKAAAKKSSRPKRTLSKITAKAKLPRQARVPVMEPSSGSASSSLDPNRAGRLQLRDPGERARRERIGDMQGISMEDRADSESVGELLEEGQTLEAETVQAIEDAPDPDQGEVRTHEVPEEDVPEEYLERD